MAFGKVIEVNEEKSLFQLLFLKEDKAQRIEVEEIDFREVEKHLERGESVVIKPRRKQKLNPDLVAKGGAREPWYFTHV